MKADTKISLCIIFWLPAFLIGAIIGTISYGFVSGLSIYKELDKWFDESEALTKLE